MIVIRPLRLQKVANLLIAALFVGVPFQAFLSVFTSSFIGHYELIRLSNECILLILVCTVSLMLIRDVPLRRFLWNKPLLRIIGLYVLLTLLLGASALLKHDVTLKAFGYGMIVNLRFFVFFVAVIIATHNDTWLLRSWRKLILIPAAIVAIFAVLQYSVLPHDFLTHFGYGPQTIAPIETINNNSHYIRVGSTLRGANPLGAYMVLIISVSSVLIIAKQKRTQHTALLVTSFLALLFTFSRSAWIGAILSVIVARFLLLRSPQAKRIAAVVTVAMSLVLVVAYLLLRHGAVVQNALYHTDNSSRVVTSSNQAHATALKAGIKDVVHEPLGRGPGTAGPASVYNGTHDSRIAENYYVQVGQETGWIGIVLFLGIVVFVAIGLFRRRSSPLALALFAGLIGISFVNLLSHAWTDDTLAYIWWGLAGIALAAPQLEDTHATL